MGTYIRCLLPLHDNIYNDVLLGDINGYVNLDIHIKISLKINVKIQPYQIKANENMRECKRTTNNDQPVSMDTAIILNNLFENEKFKPIFL